MNPGYVLTDVYGELQLPLDHMADLLKPASAPCSAPWAHLALHMLRQGGCCPVNCLVPNAGQACWWQRSCTLHAAVSACTFLYTSYATRAACCCPADHQVPDAGTSRTEAQASRLLAAAPSDVRATVLQIAWQQTLEYPGQRLRQRQRCSTPWGVTPHVRRQQPPSCSWLPSRPPSLQVQVLV